MTVVYGDCFHQ